MSASTYALVVVPLAVLALVVLAILWVRHSAHLVDADTTRPERGPRDGAPDLPPVTGSATASSWPRQVAN